jgi:hypothetical protein
MILQENSLLISLITSSLADIVEWNRAIVMKHLISTPEWKEIFPDKSIITAYRRPKKLKDILAPSKFDKQHVLAENQRPGCFKCRRKCDLCNNFFLKF